MFSVDRRVVYIFVALALSLPIIFNWSLPPAEMKTASSFYQAVENLEIKDGQIVLIASDWGPGTKAENEPQTMLAMEHLMRKRIPFALVSITPFAAPFLEQMPEDLAKKLQKENPEESWRYGYDWINLGYQAGSYTMIEGLAKADNYHLHLKVDANGTPLSDVPVMKKVKSINDIAMLMEFTGLVSAFNYWVQFFQAENYRPPFVHGCTSITIPEAFIYYSSKQIVGLHEGAAGAAWYEKLLNDKFPNRESGIALKINTSLAVAHLVVIAFIILGNLAYLNQRRRAKHA